MRQMAIDTRSGEELFALLSTREREVLELTARGLTNAQVAGELYVTTHAVKFHLAAIYRKLGVANRTEAAARYVALVGGGAGSISERGA